MKTHKSIARIALALFCAIPTLVNAGCMFCIWGGCVELAFSCSALSKITSTGVCFTLGPQMYKPATDHLLSKGGHAWIIQGEKKIPIASDAMNASLGHIVAKASESKSNDPAIKKEITAAFEKIIKGPDQGTVSPEVVARLSKELGLSVR